MTESFETKRLYVGASVLLFLWDFGGDHCGFWKTYPATVTEVLDDNEVELVYMRQRPKHWWWPWTRYVAELTVARFVPTGYTKAKKKHFAFWLWACDFSGIKRKLHEQYWAWDRLGVTKED